ncbi:hypothetical protein AWN76_005725 [Rhodothermaceae bacterium RA]|nr:hypothetical protein AWN76_005725 [Rhodothermaceae bacterium RA]
MKYSNELKVGLVIVVSAIIFFVGIRYFQDIPIFRGTYTLETAFADAGGLTSGSAVRVNGVNVGSVDAVRLDPATNQVRVWMKIDRGIGVPEGTTAEVEGLSVLGTVFVTLRLGPPANPPLPDGGFVPARPAASGLADLTRLTERAPALVDQVDSVLVGADVTLDGLNTLLRDPASELNATLASIRGSSATLEALLHEERQRLARTLENVADLTGSLNTLTTENRDSIALAVTNLNAAMERLNRNLASLERTTTHLDTILQRIEQGQGTAGLLVNDPGLYLRLDSAATELNLLLRDVRRNPRRYLRELKLIDVF